MNNADNTTALTLNGLANKALSRAIFADYVEMQTAVLELQHLVHGVKHQLLRIKTLKTTHWVTMFALHEKVNLWEGV